MGRTYTLIIPVFFFVTEFNSSNVIQDRISLANVTLTAHAGVDAFYGAEITGALIFSGADITDATGYAREELIRHPSVLCCISACWMEVTAVVHM